MALSFGVPVVGTYGKGSTESTTCTQHNLRVSDLGDIAENEDAEELGRMGVTSGWYKSVIGSRHQQEYEYIRQFTFTQDK